MDNFVKCQTAYDNQTPYDDDVEGVKGELVELKNEVEEIKNSLFLLQRYLIKKMDEENLTKKMEELKEELEND